MRLAYAPSIVMLTAFMGCGDADVEKLQPIAATPASERQLGLSHQQAAGEPALAMYEFGPAFGATMGWDAYGKSPDAGCADAIEEVNQARKGLAADVQWSSVTGLMVWEETGMSWSAYRAAGCSSIGRKPGEDTPEPKSTPPPTRCDGLRGDVSHGWQIITSTPPYQAVVNSGALGAVEQAFTAALASQCVY